MVVRSCHECAHTTDRRSGHFRSQPSSEARVGLSANKDQAVAKQKDVVLDTAVRNAKAHGRTTIQNREHDQTRQL